MQVIKEFKPKKYKYIGECGDCNSTLEWDEEDIKFVGFAGIYHYVKCPVCDSTIHAREYKEKIELEDREMPMEKMSEKTIMHKDEYLSPAWFPKGTEALVCADIAKRQQMGVAKYGTTVAENPLTHRQWLQHGYEEALDLAIYLKRAIQALDKKQDDFK